jgi:hypothetical protein
MKAHINLLVLNNAKCILQFKWGNPLGNIPATIILLQQILRPNVDPFILDGEKGN